MRIVTVINDYVISSEEYPTNGIHEELSRIRNENKWDTQSQFFIDTGKLFSVEEWIELRTK